MAPAARLARDAGHRRELGDRTLQRDGEVVEVGQRVVIGHQAEVDAAVVGHDRDAQRSVLDERDERVQARQRPPEQVERELRAGHVRHGQVEEALHRLDPRGLGEDRRRGEVRQRRQRLGADGLARLLQAAHRLVHRAEARDRVVEADRQRRVHRRDLVAERPALGLGAHRDRHHRLELDVRVVAVREEVAAQRARHHGEHDVVDRPAERVLDRLERRELAVDPREAAMGADLDVQRRARRAAQPGLRHRGEAAERRGARGERVLRMAHGACRRAGDPQRRCRPLDQRVREQRGRRGLGPRDPRLLRLLLGRVRVEVEEHRRDVDARDAVDEAVMGLADQREAVVPDPVDHPDLPQRLGAVQPLGEDAPGEAAQLLLAGGLGQRRVAHVVAGIEVRIVDPDRTALHERRERELLAIARHQREPPLQLRDEILVGGRLAVEQRAPSRRACARRPPRARGTRRRAR